MSVATQKPATLYQATWQDFVVINFDVDPRIVEKHLPDGLQVDLYNDHTFVTVIAFTCKDTMLKGMRIPFHSNYLQLQLRCYVKRNVDDQVKRGVFFLKRYVPSRRVARLMSWWTGQEYLPLKMRNDCTGFHETDPKIMPEAQYEWQINDHWNKLKIKARSERRKIRPEGKDRFILDHKYAYYANSKGLFEYRVESPPWLYWDAASGDMDIDVEPLFGKDFARPMRHRPSSVTLSRGSDVTVFKSQQIG